MTTGDQHNENLFYEDEICGLVTAVCSALWPQVRIPIICILTISKLGGVFYFDDGGRNFLRSIGKHVTDYMVSCLGRRYSS
jgi:hypothetical protein